MRIIFVEDDAMNRRVVKDMLKTVGLNMEEAVDASTGLDRLRTESFDIILMDIRMPGLDGLSAITQLRNMKSANSDVPVIVVTADLSPDVRARALAAGANEILFKPVAMNELFATIKSLAPREQEAEVILD